MGFSVSFQESAYTIDGVTALHLVCSTGEDTASATRQYLFDVTLSSTDDLYRQSWQGVALPEGKTSVVIPFVVPLGWAADCIQHAFDGTNGSLTAAMSAEETLTLGTKQYTYSYTGCRAALGVSVSETLQPTAGALEVVQADSTVPAEWGIWVQGLSRVRVSAPQAAGSAGSQIVAYYFNGGAAQTENSAELLLRDSGNVTVSVTVEDSRGRTATADLLLTVAPYAAPRLRAISSHRCAADGTADEEGTDFLAACTLDASPLDGKNPVTVQAAWKKVTETDYGAPVTVCPGSAQHIAAALGQGAGYDVKYTASDTFYTAEYCDYISSTVYLLHFRKGGRGIAVGKAAEQDELFDVGLETRLRRGLTVGGDLAVTGALALGGTDVSAALTALAGAETAALTPDQTYFSAAAITENSLVRWGRLVLYRFCGSLPGGTPPQEGDTVTVGTLPAGWYDAAHPPVLLALQSSVYPCPCTLSPAGTLTVTLTQTGQQTVMLTGVGILTQ